LQKSKGEIEVMEDVIAALTIRAEELEDKIVEGRERLKVVLEQGRQARLSQQSEQDHKLTTHQPPDWPTRSRGQFLLASYPTFPHFFCPYLGSTPGLGTL
jgi:hypothetical protein